MTLIGKPLSETIKSSLRINDNTGVDGDIERVTDGAGVNTAVKLSSDSLYVAPASSDTVRTFVVNNLNADEILKVDTTNSSVVALGTDVNTQVQRFNLASPNGQPTTADTWSMMSAIGESRFGVDLTFGTGTTPATSYTISSSAHNLVQAIWYLGHDITIDAVNVWFGQDAATGENVKFSVMSYDIVSAPTSSGGDLSNGAEVCVSPATVTGFGYEQAYMQNLTVSSANVDAGKVIMAGVHQSNTNSDLTVNMQIIYHIR